MNFKRHDRDCQIVKQTSSDFNSLSVKQIKMIVSQFSEIQTTHHLNHSFFKSYIRHIGGTNAITVHFVFIVALYLSLPSPFSTLCGFNCIFELTSNYIESKPDIIVIFAVIRK